MGGAEKKVESADIGKIEGGVVTQPEDEGNTMEMVATEQRVQSVVKLAMTDSVRRVRPNSNPSTPATPSTTNALESMLSDFAVSATLSAMQQSTEL